MYSEYTNRLDHWRKQLPHSQSVLDKLEVVLDVLASFRDRCPTLSPTANPAGTAKAPLCNVSPANIDLSILQEIFAAFAAKLAPHHADIATTTLVELTGMYLDASQTSMDKILNEADPELLSLVHLALKPQMEKTALIMASSLATEDGVINRCPICGALPYVSDLRHDTRERFLHCSLCGHQWSFPRVRCVFCGDISSERLGYFTVDGSPDIRVDFCKSCKGYLKNFDVSQHYSPSPMPVEDTATLHLDYKAIDSGLKKNAPNFIGLLLI